MELALDSASVERVNRVVADGLVGAGVPLTWMMLALRVLHPLIQSRGFTRSWAPVGCVSAKSTIEEQQFLIGTLDRLEFTVIGPAANHAARMESLTKQLGEPVLVSSQFVERLPNDWRALGAHQFHRDGVSLAVFAPPHDVTWCDVVWIKMISYPIIGNHAARLE